MSSTAPIQRRVETLESAAFRSQAQHEELLAELAPLRQHGPAIAALAADIQAYRGEVSRKFDLVFAQLDQSANELAAQHAETNQRFDRLEAILLKMAELMAETFPGTTLPERQDESQATTAASPNEGGSNL